MTKKEKEKLEKISENLLTVVKILDNYCGCDYHETCESCPLCIDENFCCLSAINIVSYNLTTLLKEKKNDRD